jgi:hypothetical protein
MIEATTIRSHTRMAEKRAPWIDRLVDSLPLRLGLTIMTTLIVASVIPLAFLANRILPPAILKFSSLGALGLSAGFASRNLLPSHSRFLQVLAGWISVVAALILLGLLTQGFAGFDPQSRLFAMPGWEKAGQFSLSLFTAWLALQAWKPDLKIEPKPSKAKPKKIARPAKGLPVSRSNQFSKRQPVRKPPKIRPVIPAHSQSNLLRQPWKSSRKVLAARLLGWKSRVNSLASGASRRLSGLVSQAQVKIDRNWRPLKNRVHLARFQPGQKVIRRKPTQVRLVGKAENRCPYCLELVEQNDPRGVKICPICHTYHHADCWAVTGTCQVPHYQE